MTDAEAPASSTGRAGIISINVFGLTDVGRIREHNEDNFLIADLTKETRNLTESERRPAVGARGVVLGVCDGMGGAAAGEVASQMAVDIIYERFADSSRPAITIHLRDGLSEPSRLRGSEYSTKPEWIVLVAEWVPRRRLQH